MTECNISGHQSSLYLGYTKKHIRAEITTKASVNTYWNCKLQES